MYSYICRTSLSTAASSPNIVDTATVGNTLGCFVIMCIYKSYIYIWGGGLDPHPCILNYTYN